MREPDRTRPGIAPTTKYPSGEDVRPEASYTCPPQPACDTYRYGHDRSTDAKMKISHGVEHSRGGESERIGGDAYQQQEWNHRVPAAEDYSGDEIGQSQIRRERDRPSDGQHGFVQCIDDPRVQNGRHDRNTNSGDHWQQRPAPWMKHSARRCGFDHLLRDDTEEERHGEIVHSERDRQCETVIAFGACIHPCQGDRCSQREHEQVLEHES